MRCKVRRFKETAQRRLSLYCHSDSLLANSTSRPRESCLSSPKGQIQNSLATTLKKTCQKYLLQILKVYSQNSNITIKKFSEWLMTLPDIISGKIIYQYVKNLFTLEHKVLFSYDITFLSISILFLWLLLGHIFWKHYFLEVILQDLEYIDKCTLKCLSDFRCNQWIY